MYVAKLEWTEEFRCNNKNAENDIIKTVDDTSSWWKQPHRL